MIVYKCDLCKKIINEKDRNQSAVVAGLGWDNKLFCKSCGKSIANFLKRNKLVEEKVS